MNVENIIDKNSKENRNYNKTSDNNYNKERRLGEFNIFRTYQRQEKQKKATRNLLEKFVQIGGGTSTTKKKIGLIKSKILLRTSNYNKLWRTLT